MFAFVLLCFYSFKSFPPDVVTGFGPLLVLSDGTRNEGFIVSTCAVRHILEMLTAAAVATDLKC